MFALFWGRVPKQYPRYLALHIDGPTIYLTYVGTAGRGSRGADLSRSFKLEPEARTGKGRGGLACWPPAQPVAPIPLPVEPPHPP